MEKKIEEIIEEMIDFQQKKVLKIAGELNCHLTPEDIRNPQDFKDLYVDPLFNYEDGILAGYLAMRTAIRSKLNE